MTQRRRVVGVAVAVIALGVAVATWRSAPTSTGAPATPEHFRPLLGEWVRPDGGYVLVVRGVRPDGAAAVAYLNPRPIQVARAEARREGDLVGLFVEFDDVNYRGSTYSLGYNARSGQLEGLYYQATLGQQYDVVFLPRR